MAEVDFDGVSSPLDVGLTKDDVYEEDEDEMKEDVEELVGFGAHCSLVVLFDRPCTWNRRV